MADRGPMSSASTVPFHTIWLGGCPPLRAQENLLHLLRLDPPSTVPLLWLDRSAWEALRHQAPLAVQAAGGGDVPGAASRERLAERLLPPGTPRHGLRLGLGQDGPSVPVLLVEELCAALAEPWRRLDPAHAALQGLAATTAGERFLGQELGLHEPAASALLEGPQMFAYLHTLFEHGQRHWAGHGLLCLASDLLRLLALAWLPGAYGDLGDVAGRLRRLPGAADAGPAGFCAHHTVAIENDLILAINRTTLQAITLATALWSWRRVRDIASRLGLTQPRSSPTEQLRAVLPHLDQRLPVPPSLLPLFHPPWTRLADYINLAYGAQPLFHPSSQLAAYSAGRRGKELLINEVGGFTGYQKAAHHLVPDNGHRWESLAQEQGLQAYAPQLGWKTYGFGTLDRLIDVGRRLRDPSAPGALAVKVEVEVGRLAEGLALPPGRLRAITLLAHQLHGLLARAHGEPGQRGACLAQVEQLCHQFTPPG